MPRPWRIVFYQRPDGARPALDFLVGLPPGLRLRFVSALDVVSAGPPPEFRDPGWKAMRGSMGGIYEVRVAWEAGNHRLFCLLVTDAFRFGKSAIVCLDGLSKPPNSPAREDDYDRVRRYADDFRSGEPAGRPRRRRAPPREGRR